MSGKLKVIERGIIAFHATIFHVLSFSFFNYILCCVECIFFKVEQQVIPLLLLITYMLSVIMPAFQLLHRSGTYIHYSKTI